MRTSTIRTLSILFSFLPVYLFANNIQIQNVSLESQVAAEKYTFIEFDISWDNSWRTTAVPNNWDAAWVFIKYSVAGGDWQHATLNTTGQIAPSGSTIDVPADGTGAFIYRNTNGNGSVDWTNARLRWNYGVNGVPDDAYLEIRVYAIEMVYVPEGSYNLGDGSSERTFYGDNDLTIPYVVISEDEVPISGGSANQLYAENGFDLGSLPNVIQEYPKGFQAFYCMKYELSQEQYKEFLNVLTREQQNSRTNTDISGTSVTNVYVMEGKTFPQYSSGIRCDPTLPSTGPITFYCDVNNDGLFDQADDGQNKACHYLTYMDLAAYLDWAGLRPMTELEYEKACRGPNPSVSGEFAWGTNNIYDGSTKYAFVDPGTPSEYFNNMAVGVGNAFYSGTTPFLAPARCGIFAASAVNANRQETGSTYYGIMEMAGNIVETIVTAQNPAGRSFRGGHGNGKLNEAGDSDSDYWPGINGNTSYNVESGVYGGVTGVTTAHGTGKRGGGIGFTAPALMTSQREFSFSPVFNRGWNSGGRGVRTADNN